jgi:hypothetical protein
MKRLQAVLPAVIVVFVVLPIYVLRLDRVVGMVVDDAWYVMLAKGLADGRGYELINAPLRGILPGYPPGFPALLSLVFHLHPEFAGNVWLLKAVSIAAMLGVALVSYWYFLRLRELPRHLAALAAIGVAATPAFVFLATSTAMSECVFTLAQLGVVAVAHRALEQRSERGGRLAVVAGLLAAATVLIRSVGVGVVAAVFLCFLNERQWKRALVFAGVVVILVGPWALYSRVHAPTVEHQQVHRGSLVYGYGEQFWMRWAGSATSGRVTAADLPERIVTNLVDISGRSMGGIFAPVLLRPSTESGEEVVSLAGRVSWTFVGIGGLPANMAVSSLLSAIVAWGFVRAVRERVTVAEVLVPISLAITVLWPFWSFRFVVPLAPFLYFYFVKALTLSPRIPAARVALLTVIGLHLFDHAGYVAAARSGTKAVDWIAQFEELETSLVWMKANLDKNAVVAATNPALVHLWTGQKTITLDRVTEPWSAWRGRGARYVACLVAHELPGASRGPYRLLYESESEDPAKFWIIDID